MQAGGERRRAVGAVVGDGRAVPFFGGSAGTGGAVVGEFGGAVKECPTTALEDASCPVPAGVAAGLSGWLGTTVPLGLAG